MTRHGWSSEFEVSSSFEELASRVFDSEAVGGTSEDLDLVSDEVKVLISVDGTFYHFFMDSLPEILKIHRDYPERLIVLYFTVKHYSKFHKDIADLLTLILEGEGVRHKKVFSTFNEGRHHDPVCKINNYIIVEPYYAYDRNITTFVDLEYTTDLVVKYSREALGLTEKPTAWRKLYLSRGEDPGAAVGPVQEGYKFYKDDLRMNNPQELEEFFKSNGYEVVNPEQDFESIFHQVSYMSEAKVIASITSSALAAMIFMNPKQVVIEIQAEVVKVVRNSDDEEVVPSQSVHPVYSMLAFMREHLVLTVPSRRDPAKVIEALSSGSVSYLI